MNTVEMNAADALMDRRLKIILPAPWIMRVFGKKTIPVWVKRPVAQNLLRISRLLVKMGINLKELKAGELGTLMECIAENLVPASRIIAYGMIRGAIASWMLNRPLALYLRCYMDMRSLAELANIIVLISGGEDFVSIITSVSNLRITQQTESQTGNGS